MLPATRRLAAGPCAAAVVLWLLAWLVAGCAGGSGGGQAAQPPSTAPSPGTRPIDGVTLPADDALLITVDAGDGSEPARRALVCLPGGASTLPDAPAACSFLRAAVDPFAPLPPDQVCTELYGGPQTASITGRWSGADVDLQLSRTDGCRIAQWDRLGPLLTVPVG